MRPFLSPRGRSALAGAAALLLSSCATISVRPAEPVCPERGPERAPAALALEPVDIGAYYFRLERAREGFPWQEIARLRTGRYVLPIVHVGPLGQVGRPRVLVVAGIHGDEVAASLAALTLLADVRRRPAAWEGIELHLLVPANPVGLANQSPYDEAGCDPDRDFETFHTPEATAVREAAQALRPALLVSLREADHGGFRVLGTEGVSPALLESVAERIRRDGTAPYAESVLGIPFGAAGWKREERAGALFPDRSLAGFGRRIGIPTVVTESPRREQDLSRRIAVHLAAVRAIAASLRH